MFHHHDDDDDDEEEGFFATLLRFAFTAAVLSFVI